MYQSQVKYLNLKEIYNDIEIQTDENGIDELSFKTKSIARKFVKVTRCNYDFI